MEAAAGPACPACGTDLDNAPLVLTQAYRIMDATGTAIGAPSGEAKASVVPPTDSPVQTDQAPAPVATAPPEPAEQPAQPLQPSQIDEPPSTAADVQDPKLAPEMPEDLPAAKPAFEPPPPTPVEPAPSTESFGTVVLSPSSPPESAESAHEPVEEPAARIEAPMEPSYSEPRMESEPEAPYAFADERSTGDESARTGEEIVGDLAVPPPPAGSAKPSGRGSLRAGAIAGGTAGLLTGGVYMTFAGVDWSGGSPFSAILDAGWPLALTIGGLVLLGIAGGLAVSALTNNDESGPKSSSDHSDGSGSAGFDDPDALP